MVTADEILTSLSAEFTLTADSPGARGSAPAETFQVNAGPDRVGIIGSVTRPFCGTCDRVRLTADGQVRNCLFATAETDCDIRCDPEPATTSSPTSGALPSPPSYLATASATPGSCGPPGPCPLSVAKSHRRPEQSLVSTGGAHGGRLCPCTRPSSAADR
jgi:hypothetical protein